MIILIILINIVSSTVIGIDLGSDTIKVAVGSSSKPVHLVKDLYLNDATPNVFAFKDKNNWAFGEGALDLCNLYPESCVYKIPLDKKSYFTGNSLKGYEMMALALTQLIQNVKKSENIYDEIKVVMAIPPSLTNREKSYLYSAITIAGINCVRFVTTTYAPIELYVNQKKYESNYYKSTAFIDIGHNGVRVSGFEFSDDKIVQKFGEYNDNVGGKTFDDNLIKMITNKYGFYFLSSQEKIQLLSEVRKAREQLSYNFISSFYFRNKMISLSRTDIENCCKEIKESLGVMIKSLKTNHSSFLLSGSIQLLGKCSQIPCLQDYIRQLLPNIRQLRSMDCNSAVCMGACYLVTDEISSQIQYHESLITSEVIFKANGKVYKIFTCSNTESFNPLIRLNNVNKYQNFPIVENNQDFMSFTLSVPENQYYSDAYFNTVDIGFSLNYYLMPVPDQSFIIQNNQQIPLKFEYKKIGWEIDSIELENSKVLVKSMIYDINQRLSDPIVEFKNFIQIQLNKYGISDWRLSAFTGICNFIDIKSRSFNRITDIEKTKSLLQDFQLLVKSIIKIDENGNFASYYSDNL